MEEPINLAQDLMKQINYAKTSVLAREQLYQAYGMVTMAYQLKAITQDEYFLLNEECVKNGINNSKYF